MTEFLRTTKHQALGHICPYFTCNDASATCNVEAARFKAVNASTYILLYVLIHAWLSRSRKGDYYDYYCK